VEHFHRWTSGLREQKRDLSRPIKKFIGFRHARNGAAGCLTRENTLIQ
jgi:hypothetical protein